MEIKNNNFLINETGAALVIALIMMIVLTVIGLASTFTSTFEIILSGEKRKSTDAFYAADSGVNIIMLKKENFVPDRMNYDPFTDYPEENITQVDAIVDYDSSKVGPPKSFSSIYLNYAYFWIESIGNDSISMTNRSTCTIDQQVVRLLPKDEAVTEVIVP